MLPFLLLFFLLFIGTCFLLFFLLVFTSPIFLPVLSILSFSSYFLITFLLSALASFLSLLPCFLFSFYLSSPFFSSLFFLLMFFLRWIIASFIPPSFLLIYFAISFFQTFPLFSLLFDFSFRSLSSLFLFIFPLHCACHFTTFPSSYELSKNSFFSLNDFPVQFNFFSCVSS